MSGRAVSRNSIRVEPSNRIFDKLGNNTYDTKDIISELIDNSIAARVEGRILRILIKIIADSDTGKPLRFVISDNASGISFEKLGEAISPAGISTQNSLNEHGLGMKQAVAALGTLEYLLTKTKSDVQANKITEFKFGDIKVEQVDFGQDSGTEIAIRDLKHHITSEAASITMSLAPYLGARYRKYLKEDNPSINIEVQIVDQGSTEPRWNTIVEACKPIYFHPATRDNKPVIHDFLLTGESWKAKLTFGYAPQDDAEFTELGISPPPKYNPYYVSLAKQGLDILLHDRVVLFHQLSEVGIIPTKHPRFNGIRGEISLIEGFSTAITKNSFIKDDNFISCLELVKDILNGERAGPGGKKKDYLGFKATPDQLPEKLLRDRLAKWLKSNQLMPKKNVHTEYVLEGIEGFIDVYADNEAWELKINQASALDVYQLFMYLDVGEMKNGYLVAPSFSTGANIAADKIAGKHKVTIKLMPCSELPIMDPPARDELDNYF